MIDHRFLDLANLERKTSKRLVGTSADVTSGYATHTLTDMLSGPPSTGTEIMFRDQVSSITLTGAVDFNVNDIIVYSESQNAEINTTTYTVTFSGDNIIANIHVTDASNVIVTGSNCRVTVNGGETEVYGDIDWAVGTDRRNFTLGENLTANDVVKVKSDGNIEKCSITVDSTETYGSDVDFSSQDTHDLMCTFDPDNKKVVVTYSNNTVSDHIYAVVGEVSGSTITWGSYAAVVTEAVTSQSPVCYDTLNNKVVMAHQNASDHGYGKVGTVSGNTITWGTSVAFNSAVTSHHSICFDPVENKILIAYKDDGNSGYGTVVVGTVSGNSITFGTPVVFNSATTFYTHLIYDTNASKVVVLYRDDNASAFDGMAKVGTVSGNSVTFGSATTFESLTMKYASGCYDTLNNKVIITWAETSATDVLKCAVGTVSGDTITFGAASTFFSYGTISDFNIRCDYDSFSNKVIAVFSDSYAVGTISGNTITFEAEVEHTSESIATPCICFDSYNNKSVIAYDETVSLNGTSKVISYGYTNGEYDDVIGILVESGTTGQSKSVQLLGTIKNGFTGETPGSYAYMKKDGTITNTISEAYISDFPIGIFISDTELLVTKQ